MRLTWKKEGNQINYHVELPAKLKKYMPEPNFFALYGFSTEDLPDRTAAIPGVGSLLPLSWLTQEPLYVEDLDRTYVAGIRAITKDHLPQNIGAEIHIDDEMRERAPLYTMGNTKRALLMTLGADSTYAYAKNRGLITDTITLWGAQKNMVNWTGYTSRIKEFAQKEGIIAHFGGCDIRTCVDEKVLEKEFDTSWWILGHSVMMLSWAAPISFKESISHISIASTWDVDFDRFWGSCPEIDNWVRWEAPGKTVHVTHEDRESRLLKFKYIVDEIGPTYLHICPFTVPNCGGCEKCIQAAVSLKQLGAASEDYGFKEPDMNKARQYKQDNPPFWVDLEV